MIIRIIFYTIFFFTSVSISGAGLNNVPWPLIPGDETYLEDEDNYFPLFKSYIKDSLIIQQQQYYVTFLPPYSPLPCSLFRVDSIGNVYTFLNTRDQLVFPFGSNDTNYVKVHVSEEDTLLVKLQGCSGTYELFPGLWGKRVQYLIEQDTAIFDDESYISFFTSVGIIGKSAQMSPGFFVIKGCVVNGIQYGSTEILLPEKQYSNQNVFFQGSNRVFHTITERINHFSGYDIFTLSGRRLPGKNANPHGLYVLKPHLKTLID